jgi:hypothetical protein
MAVQCSIYRFIVQNLQLHVNKICYLLIKAGIKLQIMWIRRFLYSDPDSTFQIVRVQILNCINCGPTFFGRILSQMSGSDQKRSGSEMDPDLQHWFQLMDSSSLPILATKADTWDQRFSIPILLQVSSIAGHTVNLAQALHGPYYFLSNTWSWINNLCWCHSIMWC